jgi:SAM-dependent methyltransferase
MSHMPPKKCRRGAGPENWSRPTPDRVSTVSLHPRFGCAGMQPIAAQKNIGCPKVGCCFGPSVGVTMAQRQHDLNLRTDVGVFGSATTAASTRFDSPYSSFTQVYDFLVGDPAYLELRRAFDQSVRRFGLTFRSVADIGCGTGRFVADLARRPVEIIGVDRSEAMLAVARRRMTGRPAVLLRQDIRRLSLPNPVDLITCHNQTVNYLTVIDDLARAFRAIARNLHRGGAFLFDFLARMAATRFAGLETIRETVCLPDHAVGFDGLVDPARGLSVVRIRVAPARGSGGAVHETHRQRWFPVSTILRLLGASGFRVLDLRPVGQAEPSAWLYVVARRL